MSVIPHESSPELFEPGKNCWKVSRADRSAVLVDAQAYFQTLAWAAEQAERSLCLLCWDIDSRIPLIPEKTGHYSSELASLPLADFLLELVEKKPNLHVYILAWDFLFLFRGEREKKSEAKRRFRRHPRIHFRFDSSGPFMVSHHQKIAVVDDQLAFCGGLDITQRRWDTCDHHVESPVRKDPEGKPYEPFHDVQMMVEGDAARELGALFRDRWKRATGKLPAELREFAEPRAEGFWPEFQEPLLKKHDVALARTIPSFRESRAVRESEALFLDSIRRAKDYIFVENQYFASRQLGDLLEERLQEPNPPEILIVVRLLDSNWAERLMGVLRARLVRRLKEKDPQNRLLVLCPAASRRKEQYLNLHSKVFISDDEVLRVGSSNLCGRSEAMDTECDLAVQVSEASEKVAVRKIRDQLLAEHLGVDERTVAAEVAAEGSLIRAVSRLQHRSDHTLISCPQQVSAWVDWLCPSVAVVDPENPRQFMGGLAKLAGALACLVALIFMFPHLQEFLQQERILGWARWLQAQPFASVGLVGLFALLASVAFPLVPLAVIFSLLLPPWQTFLCTMVGSMLSAVITYGVPYLWAQRGERGWAARLADRASFRKLQGVLEKEGFWPIVVFRLIPIAPFWIENVFMGAMGIKFWHYMLATFLSLLPGFVLISFLEDQVSAQGGYLTTIVVFSVLFALLGWAVQKGARYLMAREGHAHRR